MPDLLFDRERAALGELWRLLEEYRHGDEELTASSAQARQTALDDGERERQALARRQAQELADLDSSFHREQEELTRRGAAEEEEAERSLAEGRERLDTSERQERERLEGNLKDALWMAASVLEGGQKGVKEEVAALQHKVAAGAGRGEALWKEVEPLLARVDLDREDVEPEGKVAKAQGKTARDAEALLGRAEATLSQMQELPILRWLSWLVTVGVAVVACALLCLPGVWLRPRPVWLLGGVLAGLLLAVASRNGLRGLARSRLLALGRKFAVLLAQAQELGTELVAKAEARAEAQLTELRGNHALERRKAESAHQPKLAALQRRIRSQRETLEEQYRADSLARRQHSQQALETSRQRYKEARSGCLARQEAESRQSAAAHEERVRTLEQTLRQKARQLRQRWETEAARLLATCTELQLTGASLFGEGQNPEPPAGAPAAVGVTSAGLPFGTLTVDLRRMAGDLPAEKLAPWPPHPLHLPAFLPFPRLGGLLLQAFGQGRTLAIQAL
jgi:hypothetical protein